MSTPLDTSTPRKRFQKWNRKEQDLWLDLFEDFAGILLTALGEEWRAPDDNDECLQFHRAIKLAAELTDTAMQEAQYRFWIQEEVKPKTKRRTR